MCAGRSLSCPEISLFREFVYAGTISFLYLYIRDIEILNYPILCSAVAPFYHRNQICWIVQFCLIPPAWFQSYE